MGALYNNSSGSKNVANGYFALSGNSTGSENTAIGTFALNSNSGDANTATGTNALFNNTTGSANTANGNEALYNNSSGSSNTAYGWRALFSNTTGISNIGIGYNAQVPNGAANFQVRIGNEFISYAGVQVAWTISSDKRWKENIRTLPSGLDMISRLRPVDYVRKGEPNSFNGGTREMGLIAQEVEETLKELGYQNSGIVTKDDKGYYGVRYNDFIPLLIKAVQEQQQQIDELKKLLEKSLKQ